MIHPKTEYKITMHNRSQKLLPSYFRRRIIFINLLFWRMSRIKQIFLNRSIWNIVYILPVQDKNKPIAVVRKKFPSTRVVHKLQGIYNFFYPSDRYLRMKVAGEISRSRPLSALSAMFSPTLLPWFVYSNLLQNVSRPFINPTHLMWHGYFMHVVHADIPTSHPS